MYRLYAAQVIVLARPSAERGSLVSTVIYMHLLRQVHPEIVVAPPDLQSVPDVYSADLDADRDWDFSDIPRSGETDVCFSLRASFKIFRDKFNESLVVGPRTTADVFKLALGNLNTVCEQREFIAGVAPLHTTIWSSKAKIE